MRFLGAAGSSKNKRGLSQGAGARCRVNRKRTCSVRQRRRRGCPWGSRRVIEAVRLCRRVLGASLTLRGSIVGAVRGGSGSPRRRRCGCCSGRARRLSHRTLMRAAGLIGTVLVDTIRAPALRRHGHHADWTRQPRRGGGLIGALEGDVVQRTLANRHRAAATDDLVAVATGRLGAARRRMGGGLAHAL